MSMMMAGNPLRFNPTVKIPRWDQHYLEDPTAAISHKTFSGAGSPDAAAALLALQRFLPSNLDDIAGVDGEDFDIPVDAFSCDNFRMFDFKVKKCSLARSHDWTACPFAHPGEKARRRDPRKYHYSGSACPDFRKGACKRGDSCEYAHGVFECWLHPARYRTLPCKDGTHCRRRVCFFAHTPEQLRVLPYSSPDASPGKFPPQDLFGVSPKSAFYSPPSSPPTTVSLPVSPDFAMNLNQLTGSMRCLHINKMRMNLGSPPAWGIGTIRAGFESLPITPIKTRPPTAAFDPWGPLSEEEPAMEGVVESGRELRERIYAKLGKENSLERVSRVHPDLEFGWA